MNPLRLFVNAYRSWGELELELPTGCIAVVGENGAGKSSIVNALELALFGSRSFGDYRMDDAPPGAPLVVELEFEHGDHEYRVRRSKTARGSVKVDFEEGDGGLSEGGYRLPSSEWRPLTRETAAATQALIEETIGLSRATFRASAFLAQGDGAAFTEAQPRERKAILAEVLGLDVWDRLLELAKSDRSRLEQTGHRLHLQIEAAEVELQERPRLEAERSEHEATVEAMQDAIAASEVAIAGAQAALAFAREQEARAEGLREAAAAASRAVNANFARRAELNMNRPNLPPAQERERWVVLAAKVPELEQELDAIAEGAAELARQRELLLQRNRLLGEANQLNERAHATRMEANLLEENGPDAGACATCGQTLGIEALATTLETMRNEADQLDEQAELKDAEAAAVPVADSEPVFACRNPDEVRGDLGEARAAARQVGLLAGLEERERTIAEAIAQLEAELPALLEAEREAQAKLDAVVEVTDIEALEHNLRSVEAALSASRTTLQGAHEKLAVVNADLDRLARITQDVGANREQLASVQAELDVVILCERAYGRDGIPTMIVENAAIPQIEAEANRILAELGTSFTVELHTQRERKSSAGAVETLDIVVVGPAAARPYETFSGGERTRLNLALRIALARLLAHRRGAEVRVLVVDEPEFLDEPGVARLAGVLRGLSSDFERVILISHQAALREAFDEVLSVEKYAGASRLVPESVAVPA